MRFFYWNKNFETGLPEIDRQHRRLVDLINELASAFTDGSKLPQVQMLMNQLLSYAAEHFSDEELLTETSSLSEKEKSLHKKSHRGFVRKTQEIFQRTDLLQAEVAEQILEFLTTWLISHILEADMKIARALMPKRPVQAREPKQDQSLVEVSPMVRVLIGALSETERRFRLISDHAPVLIWLADSAGSRGFFNRAWTDFVGIDTETAQNSDYMDFVHPDDRKAYQAVVAGLLENPEPVQTEYRLRKYDGKYNWFLEKILPRIEPDGLFMGLIASATDISAIKQAESLLTQSNQELEQEVARRTAQLEQLMLTDPLTGIGNRRRLTNWLEEETARAQRYRRPLTAIFFDLDHFKHVNDTYGHAVGDSVLIQVAKSLKANLRQCDLLGRFGGEEFVVLLIETGLDDAFAVAERMRAAVSRLQFADMAEQVTISGGLAELRPGETWEKLLQRSDQALYRAKKSGRNCCQTGCATPALVQK